MKHMKKKLLVYRWDSINEPAFCQSARALGWDCVEFSHPIRDHHADADFARAMTFRLIEEKPDAVFSYDFFPLLSMLCEVHAIPYIAWIYDCPMNTLYSGSLTNAYNHIYCFDAVYTERIRAMGARHCVHYPLAADEDNPARIEAAREAGQLDRYACTVSFVGNLYNGKNNHLRGAKLRDYTKGYVEGLIQGQLQVYGGNFIAQALTDMEVQEIVDACHLRLGPTFIQDPLQMAADAIGIEVSSRERERALLALGENLPLYLYSSSELPSSFAKTRIVEKGYADPYRETPLIFHMSKINLNITSRTIASGVPQRVFDILSCGGFCLSNYQSEMAACFVDGEDLVFYEDMRDLVDKTRYYLSHEAERRRIAHSGQEKALREFSLRRRVAGILEAF